MTDQSSERHNESAFPIGIACIVIGAIFLLRNFDIISFGHNWWALFFLIPISFLARDILNRRKASGGARAVEARGSWIGLIMLTTVMVIFLFSLHWGVIWPIFIVLGGLSLLLAGRT